MYYRDTLRPAKCVQIYHGVLIFQVILYNKAPFAISTKRVDYAYFSSAHNNRYYSTYHHIKTYFSGIIYNLSF